MKKALLIIVPIIAIAVAGIVLYSNRETDPLKMSSLEEPKVASGKYYFDFDEVVYYKTTKGTDDLVATDDKKTMTFKDSITNQILCGYGELRPIDVEAIYLDSVGYTHKEIPLAKHASIREIFREKPTRRTEFAACMPVYRDIYVFKKNGKFSGMAKLCYECELSDFIGTSADTEDFGMEGEFGKLREIVK